jgi:hypothetical protein
MRRIDRLKKEAREGIRFRDHVDRRFRTDSRGAVYTCPACGSRAAVTLRPLPNEIEIGGEALATHCVGSSLAMYRNGGAA